ncbi:helix-turn-helix transcriptional regulator [Streptantibioticus parmotrematis]|uniref:helix-turn-helix transcriptional regulator n=1 Tax=Streptantibioticus parmotrematis TaxID=2873249 RepID=UPI0033FA00BC
MTTTAKSPAPVGGPVTAQGRRCARCGCVLSAYNTDETCGACTRAALPPADETPRVPARVWSDPEIREALAAWNFGQVSRLVRQRGSIRQEDVAQLTGLSQGFLSMLESGARRLTSIDRIVDFLDGLAVPADLVRVPRRRPVPRTAPAAVAPRSASLAPPPRGTVSLPAQRTSSVTELDSRRSDAESPWTAGHAVAALADAAAALTSGVACAAVPRLPELTGHAHRWAGAGPCDAARRDGAGAEVAPGLPERLRATTDVLRGMDDEHGGGSLAPAATAHLGVVVGLLRGGSYDADTGRELAATAADAARLAAWFQVESGRPVAASMRLLLAALRVAHVADDARVGAGVLLGLAVGACRTGQPVATVDLARAAREGTREYDAPALHAALLTWEARGHARLGRRREALRAMGLAAELCVRGRGTEEPQWLLPLGEGDIQAQAGSCHLDLGDHREAATLLDLAAERLGSGRSRARGLALARSAQARLRLGDPQGAYETAGQALEIAARIRSASLEEQVRPLTEALPRLAQRRPPGLADA